MNILIILASILVSSLSYAEDSKICYNIREVFNTVDVGEKTEICKFVFSNNGDVICMFTSDKVTYTNTFQVSCNQFRSVDILAKRKYLIPILSKL